MEVCAVPHGDFVVWTKQSTIMERVKRNHEFFNRNLSSVKDFFVYGVLPEIVGKWYTRTPVADSQHIVPIAPTPSNITSNDENEDDDDDSRLWCYCSKPSFGDMVMCDNKQCTIQWFHFTCVGLRIPPKGKWYCPSCRLLPKFNKQKKK